MPSPLRCPPDRGRKQRRKGRETGSREWRLIDGLAQCLILLGRSIWGTDFPAPPVPCLSPLLEWMTPERTYSGPRLRVSSALVPVLDLNRDRGRRRTLCSSDFGPGTARGKRNPECMPMQVRDHASGMLTSSVRSGSRFLPGPAFSLAGGVSCTPGRNYARAGWLRPPPPPADGLAVIPSSPGGAQVSGLPRKLFILRGEREYSSRYPSVRSK
ncbi:hypothetical protein VUR80DRAFT_1610 [Thermomyces stellatus]